MPLQISKDQLISIAEKFGTPVYVYHAERIKEQYESLLHAFTGVNAKFFYAANAIDVFQNINIG